MRHGQTDFNVERRFQGVIDHPLNAHGRAQALDAGQVLAKRILAPSAQLGMAKIVETAGRVTLVCSPLSRAFDTASIIAGELAALGADLRGPVVDERFLERSYGSFEGMTAAEAQDQYPEWVAEWRETGESAGAGIERSDLVGERMRAAAEEAAAGMSEDATLVVVSHGSAITRALLTFMGLDPLSFDALRGLDNCHWSELVHMGGGGSGASGPARWRLVAHNIGHREDVLGA